MNNTIEVLEELLYEAEHAYDNCVEGMKEDWGEKIDALTKAITTLKALESAADELPEKKTYQNTNEWCDGGAYLAKGFNDCRDLCQIPYAKQILKNEELQEQLSNWLQLELDYNKRIKELEAKIKENENG